MTSELTWELDLDPGRPPTIRTTLDGSPWGMESVDLAVEVPREAAEAFQINEEVRQESFHAALEQAFNDASQANGPTELSSEDVASLMAVLGPSPESSDPESLATELQRDAVALTLADPEWFVDAIHRSLRAHITVQDHLELVAPTTFNLQAIVVLDRPTDPATVVYLGTSNASEEHGAAVFFQGLGCVHVQL